MTMVLRVLVFAFLLFGVGPELRGQQPKTNYLLRLKHRVYRPGYPDSVNSGLIKEDTVKSSIRREARGKIGETEVVVNYGSPGLRGRIIWNGLVGYGSVWAAGGHWATAVSFNMPVLIKGVTVLPGMYALFCIPDKSEWVIILNRRADQHLADLYQESEDIVRVKVHPESLDKTIQRLTYRVERGSGKKGFIRMEWEKLAVVLPIEALE